MSFSQVDIRQLISVIEQISTFTGADSRINEPQYEEALKFLLEKGITAAIDEIVASDIDYDNTTSGLTAEELQGAIDELKVFIDTLNNYEKLVTYYEVVSGASSGNQVNVPTGGTITLDKFGSSEDAILSRVDINGNPTWESPRDSSKNIVTTSMDVNGEYNFSSTPSDATLAVIYTFRIPQGSWSNVSIGNIISETENKPEGNVIRNVSSDHIASNNEEIYVTTGTNTINITLPSPTSEPFRVFIKKVDSGRGYVNIIPASGLIEGMAVVTQDLEGEAYPITSDGTNYFIN